MSKFLLHIRFLVLIILGITVISIASNIATTSELPTFGAMLKTLGWTSFYGIPFYAANALIYRRIYRSCDYSNLKSVVRIFIIGILLSCILSVILGGILFIGEFLIMGETLETSLKWLFSSESIPAIQRMVWISASVACVMYVFTFIQNYQAHKLKTQKEKVVRISTEHESLKSQIGPHFLFNSLNVLNGLISENQDKAQEFVGELSSVYRYVLEQKDKSLVSLKEEIDFAETYMNLVQKRFEDGLEFEISGEIQDEMQIVPLSLQILLENCIKHNRISSEEPLKIKIEINDGNVWVSNNLQIKSKLDESTGKGFQNIIERYKSFTNLKVEIEKSEKEFKVKLPLLTEKIITMKINQNYTREEIKAAKKRVEELQGFYWNLASYIIINVFITFLDLRDGSYDWAFWSLAGWGIGITFHAIEVFGMFNSSSWKDRQIQKELEKRQRERDKFMENFS